MEFKSDIHKSCKQGQSQIYEAERALFFPFWFILLLMVFLPFGFHLPNIGWYHMLYGVRNSLTRCR